VSSRGSQSETSAERWGRRAITIPSYLLGGAGLLLSLPLLLPLTLLLDVIRANRLAAVRTLLFAVHYVVCEALGLSASLLLWLANLFRPNRQRFLARHYSLQYLWASLLFLGACRLFSIRLRAEPDERTGEAPLLVFIRHASIVDTLLPAVLLCRGGLRLRYVMKRELLWDPCLDVVGNRLPNLFVRRDSGESSVEAGARPGAPGTIGRPGAPGAGPAPAARAASAPRRTSCVARRRPRRRRPAGGARGLRRHLALSRCLEREPDRANGPGAGLAHPKIGRAEDSSDPARPPDRGETSRGRRVTAQK
jgi:hypothetical protein